MKKFKVCVLACGITVLAAPAFAQTTYSSTSTFNAAAGTTNLVNFQGCPSTTSSITNTVSSTTGPCSGIPSGVSFSAPSGNNLYTAAPSVVNNPTIALGPNTPRGGDLTIAFTSAQNIFGTDLFTNVGGIPSAGTAPFTISFFNGLTSIQSYSLLVPSTGSFFGLVGGSLFDRVTISESGGYATVDNVQFGTQAIVAGAAPEPGTWAMMIVGFGLAGAALRRRQKVSVKVAYAA